jgi:hypothetical protein
VDAEEGGEQVEVETEERPTSKRWPGTRRHGREKTQTPARGRTPREGTLRLGRIALWVVLGFVFLRGVGDIVGGSEAEETRAADPGAR